MNTKTNTTRRQKEIWQLEHLTASTLPSLHGQAPADGVVAFVDYLKKHKVLGNHATVVDIGCGKGRNALYLAQLGLTVYAFDYIDHAIEHARQQAQIKNVADATHFSIANMDSAWSFPDNYFDVAIDCFSSIDIETSEGREIYKNELLRTLKPGGYALVCVVAASDEFETELMKNNPGGELHSSIWPINGKFQKNYSPQELSSFYREFNIIELQEHCKKAVKLGREFNATNYWLVLRKPCI